MVVELRVCLARHQFDCRRSRRGAHSSTNDACSVAAVLCTVRGVDLVVDVGINLLHECHVFVDAASADVALVAHLRATEPGGSAPVNGSDI